LTIPEDQRLMAALAENRDRHSPLLELDVPLLRLIDPRQCSHMTTKMATIAGEWEVRVATERLWEELPLETGVYMFVWRPTLRFKVSPVLAKKARTIPSVIPDSLSYVLYVGQTGASGGSGSFHQRYKSYTSYLAGNPAELWEERPVQTRHSRLARFLTLRPLEFWYAVVKDPNEIDWLEDQLMKLLNPPLNGPKSPRFALERPNPRCDAPSEGSPLCPTKPSFQPSEPLSVTGSTTCA